MAGSSRVGIPESPAVDQVPRCAIAAGGRGTNCPCRRTSGRTSPGPQILPRRVRGAAGLGRAAGAHRRRGGPACRPVGRRHQAAPRGHRVLLAVLVTGCAVPGPGPRTAGNADLLAALGNHVCDVWTEPDCGIWELAGPRHNTFSKAGCWVALDRLVRLADRGQVSGRDADRGETEKAVIADWINEHCWSPQRPAGHRPQALG